MLHLKLIHNQDHAPRGFWLSFLWVFGIGIKNAVDPQGVYVMLTFSIWRLQTHFTIALDNK